MASVRSHNPYYGDAAHVNEQRNAGKADGFEWVDGDTEDTGPFRIMITGLPLEDVVDNDVKELFTLSVGENNVVSAKVLFAQDGLSTGIALVTLRRASDAKRAFLSFNDKAIDGQNKVHIIYIVDPSRPVPSSILAQISPRPLAQPTFTQTPQKPLDDRIPTGPAAGPSSARASEKQTVPTGPRSQKPASFPKKNLKPNQPQGIAASNGKKVAAKGPVTSSKSLLSRIDVSLKDRIGGVGSPVKGASPGPRGSPLPLDPSSPAYQAALLKAQRERKAAANVRASAASQQLGQRLQNNPKLAARAVSYNQAQKVATPVQAPVPAKAPVAKPKPKTEAELEEELRRFQRAKKWGGGDSMDTR